MLMRPGPASVCQTHLVDLIFEAQDFGESVEDVDGEALVSLGLPEDVLCHHDEGILLQREEGGKEGGRC